MIVALWVIGVAACTVSIAARTRRVERPALVVAAVVSMLAVTLMLTEGPT